MKHCEDEEPDVTGELGVNLVKKYSMTRRIVLLVLLIELLAASTTVTLVFFYERYTYFGALDISLRGRADSLLGAVVEASDDSDNVLLVRAGIRDSERGFYMRFGEKDTPLGQSGDLSQGNTSLRVLGRTAI